MRLMSWLLGEHVCSVAAQVNNAEAEAEAQESNEDAMSVDAPDQSVAVAAGRLHDALRCFCVLCPRPDAGRDVCQPPPQADRACAAVCSSATITAFAKCLRHTNRAVREAAARCFQVIGRLPDALVKDPFSDASVAAAFMDALHDSCTPVRTAMCLAICNFMAGTTRTMKTNLFERVRVIQPTTCLDTRSVCCALDLLESWSTDCMQATDDLVTYRLCILIAYNMHR
jgi:hypothetical protein